MLLAGDELGRTQRGNNNAYCQDNETSWVDWSGLEASRPACSSSPAAWPSCAAPTRCSGGAGSSSGRTPAPRDGRRRHRLVHPVRPGDEGRGLEDRVRQGARGVPQRGPITEPDPRGERVRDDSFLLLFSADSQPCRFTLPGPQFGGSWAVVLDTGAGPPAEGVEYGAESQVLVAPRAMVVLRRDGGTGRALSVRRCCCRPRAARRRA